MRYVFLIAGLQKKHSVAAALVASPAHRKPTLQTANPWTRTSPGTARASAGNLIEFISARCCASCYYMADAVLTGAEFIALETTSSS